MIKQYKDDVEWPVRREVPQLAGESFGDWITRDAEASHEWTVAHRAAMSDPRNMTTEFLASKVAASDNAKAFLRNAPFAGAQIQGLSPDETIERYRAELERRKANDNL